MVPLRVINNERAGREQDSRHERNKRIEQDVEEKEENKMRARLVMQQ